MFDKAVQFTQLRQDLYEALHRTYSKDLIQYIVKDVRNIYGVDVEYVNSSVLGVDYMPVENIRVTFVVTYGFLDRDFIVTVVMTLEEDDFYFSVQDSEQF